MYSNMKYYENICNCLRVIQQDINRKLKSANCWQRTSLNDVCTYRILKDDFLKKINIFTEMVFRVSCQFYRLHLPLILHVVVVQILVA